MARRILTRKKKTNTLWLFCEGDTEYKYFENLRITERPRLRIRPKVSGTTAKQIVQEAIKFMGSIDYDLGRDMIACFFDKDDETQNSNAVLTESKRLAGDKVDLVYSNPSFEYWILCHDGFYNSVSYDQNQVYELVKSKLGIDTKKETDLYVKTKDKIEVAKKFAKQIEGVHITNGIELISRDSTPLTLVYKLLEVIDKFK